MLASLEETGAAQAGMAGGHFKFEDGGDGFSGWLRASLFDFGINSSILRRKVESKPRFFPPPADRFFLLGPRGTGKTWWTRHEFPDALRVDLLDPETLRAMAARPERLRNGWRRNPA